MIWREGRLGDGRILTTAPSLLITVAWKNAGRGALRSGTLSRSTTAMGVNAESSDDLVDNFAEVFFEALAAGEDHAAGVEAELMQDSGVDVGDVMAVLDRVEAKFVGGAVGDPPFNTTAGHPDAKTVGVVIATVAEL